MLASHRDGGREKEQACLHHLPRSHGEFRLVRIHFFEELHGDLVLLVLCAADALEVELLLVDLDGGAGDVGEADGQDDVLGSLGPGAAGGWGPGGTGLVAGRSRGGRYIERPI